MKRSEMEKLLLNGLCDLGQWYEMSPEQVARALGLLLEPKDGWEPEEPELPKILLIHAGAVIEDTGTYRHIVAAPREAPTRTERNARILAAMAAAYNRERTGGAPIVPGLADVISKTRQGVTAHYAIGPVRATREEAEQDLRLFQER